MVLIVLFSVIALLVILYYLRQYFFRKVEELAAERVSQALQVKEKAMRIRSGYDQEDMNVSEGSKIKPVKYNSVTVLFADIQGFTKIVEHLNREVLIDELDHFFFKFDSVVEKHGI